MSGRKANGYSRLKSNDELGEEGNIDHEFLPRSSRYGTNMSGQEEAGAAGTKRKSARGQNVSGKGNTEASRLMGEVQNVKSKTVYVFGDGTVADTEDETIELNQMSRRYNQQQGGRKYKSTASSSQYDNIVTKEIPIQKTDTLQSLSIKFRCPVSEIKRINGLYTDQELYALTSIKIPVRSHQSILQEELDEVARERVTDSGDLLTKTRCAADIVSSETSEDEEHRAGAGRQSVMDMVELHSDPEDEEAYALLDRDRSQRQNKTLDSQNKRDRKKFDKILNRKDEEIKALSEKVQKQADAVGEVTSFMDNSSGGGMPTRPSNCLSTIVLSVPCLIITSAFIVIGLPLLFYFFHK